MENILKTLLAYNDFSNRRFIETLNASNEDLEKEMYLFSHILNAHNIWNCRISEGEYKFHVWQVHDKKYLLNLHEENQVETKKIIETDKMDRSISYSNSQGDSFSNIVGDILVHVFNHGTYHRGQIAQLLRGKSIDPPGTDYITFKRQGQ
jgi:uncharacterized damage-inducible protein DinB